MNMNAIFDIKRFGNLFFKDNKEVILRSSRIIFIWAGVYMAQFLLRSFDGDTDMSFRSPWFTTIFMLFVINVPLVSYFWVNDKQKGIYYAMLPASSLEKTISMIINNVVILPLAFFVSLTLLDTLLTLIFSQNGFPGMIFSNNLFSMDRPSILILCLLGFLYSQSFLIFFNLCFKNHNKGLKSISMVIAIHILLMIICAVILKKVYVGIDDVDININSIADISSLALTLMYSYLGGVTLLMWVLTGIRIKRIQYR